MVLNCGVGKDSWESLGLQGDQTSQSKVNQSWIFIRMTNVEAESSVFWPPDANNWPIRKNDDAGKDWRQEEKGMTEDEMVGWHHWLNVPEFEQALGHGEGHVSPVCCNPWGRTDSDRTEWLYNNDANNFTTSGDSDKEKLWDAVSNFLFTHHQSSSVSLRYFHYNYMTT